MVTKYLLDALLLSVEPLLHTKIFLISSLMPPLWARHYNPPFHRWQNRGLELLRSLPQVHHSDMFQTLTFATVTEHYRHSICISAVRLSHHLIEIRNQIFSKAMITHEILVRKMARKEPRKAVLYQTCTQSLLRERGERSKGTRWKRDVSVFCQSPVYKYHPVKEVSLLPIRKSWRSQSLMTPPWDPRHQYQMINNA